MKKFMTDNPICATIIICFSLVIMLIAYFFDPQSLMSLIAVLASLGFLKKIMKFLFG